MVTLWSTIKERHVLDVHAPECVVIGDRRVGQRIRDILRQVIALSVIAVEVKIREPKRSAAGGEILHLDGGHQIRTSAAAARDTVAQAVLSVGAVEVQDFTTGGTSLRFSDFYFDGYDRQRYDLAQNITNTLTYSSITYYDALGRVHIQYMPFFNGAPESY